MRIADHAVAMQSSHALQQPSNAVHQQQTISPEAARAAADIEAQQHAKQVSESEKTENQALRDEKRAKGSRRNRKGDAAHSRNNETEPAGDALKGAPEQGKGGQLDLLA